MPFDPREITPTASINRVRMVDEEDPNKTVKTAYELLGAQAVYDVIRRFADGMDLPRPLPDHPTPEIMQAYQACLTTEDAEIQASAWRAHSTVAKRLRSLIAVLRRGNATDRALRPEWDDSYWEYWLSVEKIVLGGGLIRGGLWSWEIVRWFRENLSYIPDVKPLEDIDHDPYGPYMPLVGAACCASEETTTMAVLDFGGTSVKTGIAHYDDGILISIDERGSFPGPLGEPYSVTPQSEDEKLVVFRTMVNRIAQTISGSSFAESISHGVVSVAAYISPNGHPYPNSIGGYAALYSLAPNLQVALAEAVSQTIGKPITLRLIHDGTAAATVHPGAAVLVFGTAIGFGSHPAVEDPRTISAEFKLS